MQTRTMRACGIAVVGLLTALAASSVSADTPNTPRDEPSLLGVKLMASYSDVMRKFGQPNEIQIGDPTVTGNGQSAVAGGPGMGRPGGMGGLPGMGGMMGRPGGMQGMMSSSPGGMMSGRGMQGMMSSSPGGMQGMMSSSPGGMQGMMSGMQGMMSGGKGMMSSSPGAGGLPGLGGRVGGAGAPGGLPGMGAGNAGAQDSGESTWWYHFPHEGLHYSFLFNKDGRVIQIQAYGQKPFPKIVAPRSALGVTLGTDLGQVIKKYGWSNDGEHSGEYVVMRYGKRDRIAFQTVNNKVKGIVLGRVNPEPANSVGVAGIDGPGGYPGGSGMGVGGGPGGGE